jgi:16S rRNA (guanine527-N7)-methyltransferase
VSQNLKALLEPASLDAVQAALLARYGSLVLEANRYFNLTGAKSEEELAAHLLDSLSLRRFVQEPYVDVGAGAGLPSIPLAIALSVPVVMVESNAKKAQFLSGVIQALDLDGAVIAERAEVAAHQAEFREHFQSGTARAVGSAPTVAELLLPFIRVGGVAILQRGALPPEERQALEDATLVLGASIEDELQVEGSTKRIVILKKRRQTPARFPRRTGVPQKRPLCG